MMGSALERHTAQRELQAVQEVARELARRRFDARTPSLRRVEAPVGVRGALHAEQDRLPRPSPWGKGDTPEPPQYLRTGNRREALHIHPLEGGGAADCHRPRGRHTHWAKVRKDSWKITDLRT